MKELLDRNKIEVNKAMEEIGDREKKLINKNTELKTKETKVVKV